MKRKRRKLPRRFAAFLKFHQTNPIIYQLFLQFTRRAHEAGRARFSARVIGERIRWYMDVDTKTVDGFKINDHHWPYYARLVCLEFPEFNGLFVYKDERFDATSSMIIQHCLKGNQ